MIIANTSPCAKSATGQSEKNSARAYVFRFALKHEVAALQPAAREQEPRGR
jgi:hypothetical protein